jgi:hypothetical protein
MGENELKFTNFSFYAPTYPDRKVSHPDAPNVECP